MIKFDFKFDKDGFEKTAMEAAAKQAQEKCRAKGFRNVRVTAVKRGIKWDLDFKGPEDEVKKAAAMFGEK